MQVFHRGAKAIQRSRAARAADALDYEYLKNEFAQRLVDRLADVKRKFPLALDLGCGLGSLRAALPADKVGELVITDHSSEMLDRAQARGGPVNVVRAEVIDEERLADAFDDNQFDLVASNLSLHWVNDLPGVFAQINRILKPDGLFLANMLGGDTLQELRVSMQLAEEEIAGGISPRVSPMCRVRDVGGLLGSANFRLTTVDLDHVLVDYPDMNVLMRHLQAMGENNAVVLRKPHFGRRAFARAGEIYKDRFSNEENNVLATFQVINMAGWVPASTQQAPLERGSAKHRLLEDVKPSH